MFSFRVFLHTYVYGKINAKDNAPIVPFKLKALARVDGNDIVHADIIVCPVY